MSAPKVYETARTGPCHDQQLSRSADFHMQSEAESDGVERLVEVIQGDAWSGGSAPAEELLSLYEVTCEARACPRLPVDVADIDAVRARFRELTVQWNAVPVGGTLALDFNASTGAA